MFFRLDNKITDASLDNLMVIANDLQPLEVLDVYIRGEGGELGVAEAIIDIFNKISLTNTINVYGYEFLISSHFHIFFKMKAHSKTLSPQSYGMIHKGSWSSTLLEGGGMRKDDFDLFMKEYFTSSDTLKDLNKLTKFNSEETKMFKNNHDVYISPIRMLEILEYNKNKTILKPIKYKLNENNQIEFHTS